MSRPQPHLYPSCAMGRGVLVVAGLSLSFAVSGCFGDSSEDLSVWIAEQRKQQRVRLTPIVPPKKFVPQAFTAPDTADPYNPQRLSAALRRELKASSGDTSALIKPELARQAVLKQPLESTPLDSMGYVGQLIKGGQPVALIRVNGLLYQVRIGDYLGQNFGKVQRISDSEVGLREIVQDSEGEWSERRAVLQLIQGAR